MGYQGLIKAAVTIPMKSGVTADAATNTLWFATSELTVPTTVQYQQVITLLYNAYNQVRLQYSADVDLPKIAAKLYHWVGPAPILPAYSAVFGLPATGQPTGTAPPELSVVLSAHAQLNVSGESNARRRNRIYVGPLATALSNRPSSTQITAVQQFGAVLYDTTNGANANPQGIKWVAYSSANNGGPLVVGGWVDNAWDIQRRRGTKASTRTTFGS